MSRRRWLTGAIGILSAALVLGGCGSSGPERTPRLTVVPRAALVDRARSITISGLDPGEHVTLDARTSIAGAVWGSSTEYAADRHGTVDVATAQPISGSYHGASAMGPFWSESDQHGGPTAGDSTDVTRLTATTGSGHSTSVTVLQSYRGPGVRGQPTTLARQGFVGEYFTPPGQRRRGPAMIVWGGSEGGDAAVIPRAELLASHGIPTLAIAYFDAPGLPCSLSNIPIEYFVKAIRWLRRQSGVDPGRVWAWSVSRGSEPLGLVASHWPGLVHGLIDESGSSVVNESFAGNCRANAVSAWTLGGRVVPYDTAFGATGLIPSLARPATIPFARFHGPVMLVSGADDAVWPSSRYEDIIMHELSADPAPHVHVNYAAAGHADLGPPYTPELLETNDHGTTVHLGGTEAGYEAAHLQDWPALLRFVTDH
jgi:hypothetical protein